MKDHRRILGTLFIAWGVLQLVGSAALVAWGRAEIAVPWLYWLSTIVVAIAYGWVGLRLRAHDARFRVASILLSVLALLSFPIGTALGGYGLWALLRRPRAEQAAH